MKDIDTSDYYPYTPGGGCDPEVSSPIGNWEVGSAQGPEPGRGQAEDPGPGKPWETLADRCANILSWVFVPLMMPLYAVILIFTLSVLQFVPTATKWVFCAVIFGLTALVPMLLVMLLKRMGIIDDIGLNGRKERLIPYIISILSMGGAGWFMMSKGAPIWTGMFFFGGALAGMVNLLVNFKWKISAHAAAAAGIVALLICISREPIPHPCIDIWVACAIGAAGLLGAARIWLGRHTVLQVLAGSAVGFLCVFFLTLI